MGSLGDGKFGRWEGETEWEFQIIVCANLVLEGKMVIGRMGEWMNE